MKTKAVDDKCKASWLKKLAADNQNIKATSQRDRENSKVESGVEFLENGK